jgi:hypothetical protein
VIFRTPYRATFHLDAQIGPGEFGLAAEIDQGELRAETEETIVKSSTFSSPRLTVITPALTVYVR